MNYDLIFDEIFIKSINKLPKLLKERIWKKLQQTKQNPYHFFIKLTGREEYKLRVGDYRIIADINDNKLIILLLHVDHRRRIYKII
jgi:mRNA interferase RelE/StbE